MGHARSFMLLFEYQLIFIYLSGPTRQSKEGDGCSHPAAPLWYDQYCRCLAGSKGQIFQGVVGLVEITT